MLQRGDKVILVACSNGLSLKQQNKINNLCIKLQQMGLKVTISPYLYRQESFFSANGKQRAAIINQAYQDHEIKAIFDVSGGDIANGILPYLDYQMIQVNYKPFFGYSDLTTILNALYHLTKQKQYLFQIRNIVSVNRYDDFKQSILDNQSALFDFKYSFIQGNYAKGVVVGGNIRCFLKLAGTDYLVDFENKILFLESFSGSGATMTSYLTQLKLMGVFDKINGLVLGTFSAMDNNNERPDIVSLALSVVDDDQLPIIKTDEIGHGFDSKCLIIGQVYEFKKD